MTSQPIGARTSPSSEPFAPTVLSVSAGFAERSMGHDFSTSSNAHSVRAFVQVTLWLWTTYVPITLRLSQMPSLPAEHQLGTCPHIPRTSTLSSFSGLHKAKTTTIEIAPGRAPLGRNRQTSAARTSIPLQSLVRQLWLPSTQLIAAVVRLLAARHSLIRT